MLEIQQNQGLNWYELSENDELSEWVDYFLRPSTPLETKQQGIYRAFNKPSEESVLRARHKDRYTKMSDKIKEREKIISKSELAQKAMDLIS